MLKLGKKPARPNAVKLRLAHFVDWSKLPTPPSHFGHEWAISNWGMLANDKAGDCVWAGAAHETMMWCREAGAEVQFRDSDVLSDYSAVTGYKIGDESTDQGTDMQLAAKYRQDVGIVDAKGHRHKIGAYLALDPGDIRQHLIALYMFGAVGIGIEFPNTAMDQFETAKVWDVESGSRMDGGHYIPLVARREFITCVTWGKLQPMTDRFFKKYNDESVVYVSEERMVKGYTLEGFDMPQLKEALGWFK